MNTAAEPASFAAFVKSLYSLPHRSTALSIAEFSSSTSNTRNNGAINNTRSTLDSPSHNARGVSKKNPHTSCLNADSVFKVAWRPNTECFVAGPNLLMPVTGAGLAETGVFLSIAKYQFREFFTRLICAHKGFSDKIPKDTLRLHRCYVFSALDPTFSDHQNVFWD